MDEFKQRVIYSNRSSQLLDVLAVRLNQLKYLSGGSRESDPGGRACGERGGAKKSLQSVDIEQPGGRAIHIGTRVTPPTRRFDQSSNIVRIAGRDTVTTARYEHDSCIDRVRHSSFTKKSTTGATAGFVNADNVDGVEESSEIDLAPPVIAPHLRYDEGRGSQLHTVLRRYSKSSHHTPLVALDGDKRTGVRAPGHSPILSVAETQLRLSPGELL